MLRINNLEKLIEQYSQGDRYFQYCYFENIDISRIDLSNANFSGSRWINCNLVDCNLSNRYLTLADFHNSTLTKVNLQWFLFTLFCNTIMADGSIRNN